MKNTTILLNLRNKLQTKILWNKATAKEIQKFQELNQQVQVDQNKDEQRKLSVAGQILKQEPPVETKNDTGRKN